MGHPPNGHASAVQGINVIYDALGRAVEGDWPGGGMSEKVYDETGLTVVMQGTSMGVARIPLPGGAWARYTPSGLTDYWHPDWLGTSRLESTPGRTVEVSAAFAPFGEVYAHADNFDLSFTGNTTTDTVIDEYDFPYRRYHPVQGRWISPDPVRGSGNKYVYAENNPLSKVDPYGLISIIIDGIDYGGVDAEFGGDKFESPFAQGESNPPAATQTPAQPQTTEGQGTSQGEPTATTGNQQQAQAAQAQAQGEPHGFWWKLGHALGLVQTDADRVSEARGFLSANNADLVYYNGQWQRPASMSDAQVLGWWNQYNQDNRSDVESGGRGLAFAGVAARLTAPQARDLAKYLGFRQVKVDWDTHGQPVFVKDGRYISPDVDGHSGGTWKEFDRRGNRIATLDHFLNPIGQ